MSERSERGSWKQHVCDQLRRMREDGEARIRMAGMICTIVPSDSPGEAAGDLFVIRCKRGYALAELSDKDSGSRLRALTTSGDAFFVPRRDVLARVRRST